MTKTLRVGGVPEHFNLPWRLACAANAFATTGIRVAWQEVAAGTGELTRALRDGELDLALVLTEGAIADVMIHDMNRLVKVWVSSPLTWGIHVAGHSTLKEASTIQDATVAISRYGSGSHLIPIVDAAMRGWPTTDMNFVVVDNLDGARRALRSGKAEVFFWEKHMTQPLVDSGEFRRVGAREVPWPAFVVSVRRKILQSHATEVRAVLDVATNWAKNLKRRSSATSLISRTYGIQEADAGVWLDDVRWAGGYRRPSGALTRAAKALASQGVLDDEQIDLGKIWERI